MEMPYAQRYIPTLAKLGREERGCAQSWDSATPANALALSLPNTKMLRVRKKMTVVRLAGWRLDGFFQPFLVFDLGT